MKSRLGVLASMAVLSSLLVSVSGSPAEAATGVSARLNRATPIVGETVRVYGTAAKSPRVVKLQTMRRGHWAAVSTSRTRSGGAYSFAVRAGSGTATYRVVAPKAGSKAARASSRVRVHGVRQQVTFAPPVALNGKTLSPAAAIVSPARPGATVRLLRQTAGGYVTAQSAKQNGAGAVKFYGATAGPASSPTRYQAQALVGRAVASAPSALGVALSKTAFRDEFTGSRLSSQWQDRLQNYTAKRKCSKTLPNLVRVGGGVATLKIRRIGAKAGCAKGAYANPMITSGSLSQPYGYYSARIRFERNRGMHGAFWMQGGSEIDVAEHFGYHRPISNLVHNGSVNTGNFSIGGDRPQTRTILGRSTPYSAFHTYSVTWSPAGYVFALDGVPTLVTGAKNTSVAAQIILSLQVSDWELPALNPRTVSSAASAMQVDYVRAWQ